MLQAKQKGLDRKDKRESDLCGGIPKQVHYHIKERGTTIQKNINCRGNHKRVTPTKNPDQMLKNNEDSLSMKKLQSKS